MARESRLYSAVHGISCYSPNEADVSQVIGYSSIIGLLNVFELPKNPQESRRIQVDEISKFLERKILGFQNETLERKKSRGDSNPISHLWGELHLLYLPQIKSQIQEAKNYPSELLQDLVYFLKPRPSQIEQNLLSVGRNILTHVSSSNSIIEDFYLIKGAFHQ